MADRLEPVDLNEARRALVITAEEAANKRRTTAWGQLMAAVAAAEQTAADAANSAFPGAQVDAAAALIEQLAQRIEGSLGYLAPTSPAVPAPLDTDHHARLEATALRAADDRAARMIAERERDELLAELDRVRAQVHDAERRTATICANLGISTDAHDGTARSLINLLTEIGRVTAPRRRVDPATPSEPAPAAPPPSGQPAAAQGAGTPPTPTAPPNPPTTATNTPSPDDPFPVPAPPSQQGRVAGWRRIIPGHNGRTEA